MQMTYVIAFTTEQCYENDCISVRNNVLTRRVFHDQIYFQIKQKLNADLMFTEEKK